MVVFSHYFIISFMFSCSIFAEQRIFMCFLLILNWVKSVVVRSFCLFDNKFFRFEVLTRSQQFTISHLSIVKIVNSNVKIKLVTTNSAKKYRHFLM